MIRHRPWLATGYSLDFKLEDTTADEAVEVAELSAPRDGGWRCMEYEIGGKVRAFIYRNSWAGARAPRTAQIHLTLIKLDPYQLDPH